VDFDRTLMNIRPLMETHFKYDDRRLMCSLDPGSEPAPTGAKHYIDNHGYSIISNLFKPDEDIDLDETESILSTIFGQEFKILNFTNQLCSRYNHFELSDHSDMSLLIQIDTNSRLNTVVTVGGEKVDLFNNEAILFDRKRVSLTVDKIESRYTLLARAINRLIMKKDDTFFRYVCIDYQINV